MAGSARNLPNALTLSRVVMAIVLFALLGLVQRGLLPNARLWLNVSLGIFVTAGLTDVLDGYLARKWGQATVFGRIVDPFADKVIVCGTFVFLIPIDGSLVAPWVVVTVLARELLVDGLRGYAESCGVAFPAMWSGKAKMFAQSACLTWLLAMVANWPQEPWAPTINRLAQYAVVAACVISGLHYVQHAYRELSQAPAEGA
ncbi:MAG: CDP-diacylglycerol--glycerol-3-phosphate 3-phosphatidyltransferase [Planctomycetota bacterium]